MSEESLEDEAAGEAAERSSEETMRGTECVYLPETFETK